MTSDISRNVQDAANGISEVNENVAQSSMVSSEIARDIADVSQVSSETKEGSLLLQESSQELKKIAESIGRETNQFDLGKVEHRKVMAGSTSTARSLLRWSESLSVGLDSIDSQHKTLIDLINELYKQMKSGATKDAIGEALGKLIDYTGSHFKYEEELFAQYKYPEQASHKELHHKMVSQVVDFQKQFKEEGKDISIELMEFLKEWLLNHIKKTDMKYSSFLQSKGVV